VIENAEETAAIFNAFKDEKRATAFLLLAEGVPGKEVAEEIGVTRPSLQYYIQDFKDLDLIRSEGNSYVLTEKGEKVQKVFEDVSEVLKE